MCAYVCVCICECVCVCVCVCVRAVTVSMETIFVHKMKGDSPYYVAIFWLRTSDFTISQFHFMVMQYILICSFGWSYIEVFSIREISLSGNFEPERVNRKQKYQQNLGHFWVSISTVPGFHFTSVQAVRGSIQLTETRTSCSLYIHENGCNIFSPCV